MNIKDYVLENYDKDQIKYITNHGCVGGVSGITYYYETTKFHDDHEKEIWDMLWEDAQDQGINTLELIAQFNGSMNVASIHQLKNILCWYAVEKVAFEIINSEDN